MSAYYGKIKRKRFFFSFFNQSQSYYLSAWELKWDENALQDNEIREIGVINTTVQFQLRNKHLYIHLFAIVYLYLYIYIYIDIYVSIYIYSFFFLVKGSCCFLLLFFSVVFFGYF